MHIFIATVCMLARFSSFLINLCGFIQVSVSGFANFNHTTVHYLQSLSIIKTACVTTLEGQGKWKEHYTNKLAANEKACQVTYSSSAVYQTLLK